MVCVCVAWQRRKPCLQINGPQHLTLQSTTFLLRGALSIKRNRSKYPESGKGRWFLMARDYQDVKLIEIASFVVAIISAVIAIVSLIHHW